jgi:hypothetical protein
MAMAEWARETQYQVSAKMWEASVKMNCWRINFKLIQFIVDDYVEMFGSDWQKLVCKSTFQSSMLSAFGRKEERKWQEWPSTGEDRVLESQ